MDLTKIQIFLDSVESILYDIFVNKNIDYNDSYNIIYKFTFNNINTIIYKDILDYTQILLKKIYIQLYDEISSKFINYNNKSINVMKKLGLKEDIKAAFNHPKLPIDHPLSKHVLYRISKNDIKNK